MLQNSFEGTNITKFLLLAYLKIENILFCHQSELKIANLDSNLIQWKHLLFQIGKHVATFLIF